MFEIIVGSEVEKFMLSLELDSRAKIDRSIELLEELGYRLRMPHSKRINKSLFELRMSGRQEIRIFYCFYNNQIYLLSGFIKKSQKTPQREIDKAVNRIKYLTKYNL